MTKRYVETVQSEFRKALGLVKKPAFDRYPDGSLKLWPDDDSEYIFPVKGKKRRPKRMIQT